MDFEDFKQLVLNAAQCCDYLKFYSLVSEHVLFSARWRELCTKSGDTVLHFAASSGCVDIMKFYHEGGYKAILEQKNVHLKTPLHVAAHSGQLQCVEYLLSCDVDVNALKRSDWTPLMLACTKPNLDIVKKLVSHGARIRMLNKDGWNALHIACREGHVEIVKYLLGICPILWDSTSKNRRTPLHSAALHGYFDIVKALVEVCHYKNVKDSCGTTPLMDAVSRNHNHVVQYLIDEGASFTKRDVLGRNALHIAAEVENLFCIENFVENCPILIDSVTYHGLTPLHMACKANSLPSVRLLVQLGADFRLTDNRGRSAVDYTSNEEIKTYLLNL